MLYWGGVGCNSNVDPSPEGEDKVTVTFDSDGGSEVTAKQVEKGGKIEAPASEKNGYKLTGWLDGDVAFDFDTPVTENKTLKAKWEVVKYKITYENVKENNSDNPTEYTIETPTIELKAPAAGLNPEKPIFVQWCLDEAFENATTGIQKGSTGDKTFYAEWNNKALEKFKVTFELVGIGGSFDVEVVEGKKISQDQIQNAMAAIPANYEFKGAFKDKECKNEIEDVTAESINADTVIYVKVAEKELKGPFKIGETYAGVVTYEMIENQYSEGDALGKDIYFPIDVSGITLKANDTLKVSCKISGLPQTKGGVGCQASVDNYAWQHANVKTDGESYNFIFTAIEGKTENPQFKFAPTQAKAEEADKAELIGGTLKLTISDLKITYTEYVPGAEVTENIFTGEFKPFETQFSAKKLQELYVKSNGDAKLIVTYTLNDYTPEYDYDGVGALFGWDVDWKNVAETVDKDYLKEFGLNIGCSIKDYEAGKEVQTEFMLADILAKDKAANFTFNLWPIAEGKGAKVTITSIDVKYTKK